MDIQIVKPFEPVATKKLPEGEQWVAQVKWDGVRILNYYDGNTVRLFNRKLHERTLQFPEITDINKYCKAQSIVLDGEIIALAEGKPSFHHVMKRDRITRLENLTWLMQDTPVIYMIFDILYLNGEWVNNRPLHARQRILKENLIVRENVRLVENFSEIEQIFDVVQQASLEGIVCKDINSSYAINGKDNRWLKIKNYHDLYAVIGGVTFNCGQVNALLLGLYNEAGELNFIGRVGSGKITDVEWCSFTKSIKPLVTNQRPFINKPDKINDVAWLRPEITLKVTYIHWTEGKLLRQPVIQAFVDVSPKECTFKQ